MSHTKLFTKVEGDIPIDLHIPNDSSILVISKNQRFLTHALHKYPAKFIPEYPRWAIKKYATGKRLVLDPFCGSGTTNVEAKLAGCNSFAVDPDPLARLIVKVKTTNLKEEMLFHERDRIFKGLENAHTNLELPDSYDFLKLWFRPNVAQELFALKKIISRTKDENVRDFLLICFSSIIRKVSNADPKLVLPKISKFMRIKEQEGRQIDVFGTFKKTLNNQIENILQFSKITSPKVTVKIAGTDARNIHLKENAISVAVTSPPYLNAHDYVRAHKLEMYWLDMAKDSKSLIELDRSYVGTEKFYSHEYATLPYTSIDELDKKIDKISLIDQKRAYIVARFFNDMQKNFDQIYTILENGGHYVMFVGNNIVRKIEVPTHKYMIELAKRSGFKSELHFSSPLIKRLEVQNGRNEHGGFIEHDWILVFKK